MKFSKEFLLDLMDDEDSVVEDEIIDQSRWSTIHGWVFKHEGKFYSSSYSVGSTEYQEESPYEDDDDIIECPEVVPVETVVVKYIVKDKQ